MSEKERCNWFIYLCPFHSHGFRLWLIQSVLMSFHSIHSFQLICLFGRFINCGIRKTNKIVYSKAENYFENEFKWDFEALKSFHIVDSNKLDVNSWLCQFKIYELNNFMQFMRIIRVWLGCEMIEFIAYFFFIWLHLKSSNQVTTRGVNKCTI